MDKSEKYNYNRINEYLPVKLIQKLNDDILNDKSSDYRTKNNFLRGVGLIYHHQMHESYGLDGYVPLGSSYWKKVFSHDYHKKVINPLLELNIIQSLDFGYRTYSSGIKQNQNKLTSKDQPDGLVGIRYRINPEFTNSECDFINYIKKGVIKTKKEEDDEFQEFQELNAIPDKSFHVGIYTERALAWIEENMEKTCKKLLKLDYTKHFSENKRIKYIEYIDGGTYNTSYGTIKSVKEHTPEGKQLFFYDDTYYIDDVEQFLSKRIELMKYFYKREISKVSVSPLKFNRSTTNLRVHNYLTNFPSSILQYITINNKTVVQIDLKTSQFLLFANLLNVYILKGEQHLLGLFKQKKNLIYLKKFIGILKQYQYQLPSIGVDINYPKSTENSSHDVTRFIRDVFFNDFYVVVQTILGLSERYLAKDEVFKLLFKKDSKKGDAELEKLKKIYPIVMAIISDFKTIEPLKETSIKTNKQNDLKTNLSDLKKEKANREKAEVIKKLNERKSNFSVFLQCIEAEIFIDNVLLPLRKQGIPCFTRHDSIVVANGYEDQVKNVVDEVFSSFGFKYKGTFEEKWWEVYTYKEMEDSGMWDNDSEEDIRNLVLQFEAIYATTNAYLSLTEVPAPAHDLVDEIQNLSAKLKYDEAVSIVNQPLNWKSQKMRQK